MRKSVGVIFDINEHGTLFENAVQKVSGNTPGYNGVGSGWTNRGVVGGNTGNDDCRGEE